MYPNTSELKVLKLLVNQETTSDLYCKLYTNNLTISEGVNTASITQIVSGSGSYAPIRLTNSSWTVAAAADTVSAVFPTITYNFTGAVGNVYGYYVTTTNPETLIQVNSFSAGPYNMANAGDQISLNLTIILD